MYSQNIPLGKFDYAGEKRLGTGRIYSFAIMKIESDGLVLCVGQENDTS